MNNQKAFQKNICADREMEVCFPTRMGLRIGAYRDSRMGNGRPASSETGGDAVTSVHGGAEYTVSK
jgi:hypothetical protein